MSGPADLASSAGMTPRFSERLRQRLGALQEQRRRVWGPLMRPEAYRRVYPELLIQTFHYVKFSCRLMEDALTMLPPHAAALRHFLVEHLERERGHDTWLVRDLRALGYPEAITFVVPPCPAVAALVGSQMFMTRDRGGASVLGYIYVLEATPPPYEALAALTDSAGISRDAASTFLEHSRIDPEHANEIREVLDDPSLTDDDREAIVLAAEIAAQNVCRLAEELVALSRSDGRVS